ncbi:hypothetical protein LINGRAHAP2_LOCUS16394 [Linum grandiflorum]
MNIIMSIDDPCCVFRLRCLNKSWCRLLSSPNFLHSFLLFNGTTQQDSGRQIIVLRDNPHLDYYAEYHDERGKVFSCLSYDTLQETTPTTAFDYHAYPPPVDRYRRGKPLAPSPPDVTIVGSCDGILCLSIRHYGLSSPSDLILWNPTTSETKLLPPFPKLPFVRYRHRVRGRRLVFTSFEENIGFGFDSTSADYKIVATVCWNPKYQEVGDENYPTKRTGLSCWIYSMRDDKWTKFPARNTNTPSPFLYGYYERANNSGDNDICYWWRITYQRYFYHLEMYRIMSFDMTNQSFKLVKVRSPRKLSSFQSLTKLFVLKNSLMVIYESFGGLATPFAPSGPADDITNYIPNRCYQIWTLLNYNNSKLNTLESSSTNWIRLYTLDPSLIITPMLNHQLRYKRRVPGIWKDGYYFSVTSQGKLTVISPERDQLRHLNIRGGRSSFQLEAFAPSTLSFQELRKSNDVNDHQRAEIRDKPSCFDFFKRK